MRIIFRLRQVIVFALVLFLMERGASPALTTANPRYGGLNAGSLPSLALRTDDIPIIVSIGSLTNHIRLIICNDTRCTLPTIRNLAQTQGMPSLALSPTNLARVTYLDAVRNRFGLIRCANQACSVWSNHLVDATPLAGTMSRLRLASGDLPVIVYSDDDSGLRLAVCGTPTCTTVTIRTIVGAPSDPSEPSLVLTDTNIPIISFYDAATDDLKIILCNDRSCTSPNIRTIDAAGDVGHWSSVGLTTTGLPVISYYDKTNNSLKIARCTAADCSTSTTFHLHRSGTFPSGGLLGMTSIVVPSTNIPVISFYDNVASDLILASCNNPICVAPVITTIDARGDFGDSNSLALTSAGTPVIAYHDNTNEALKLSPGNQVIDRGQPSFHTKSTPNNASYVASNSATLTWRGVPEATSYRYCFTTRISDCLAESGWHEVGSAKNISKTGLVHNTTYFWQILASNAAGSTLADNGTAWSFTVSIPPAAFTKTAPTSAARGIPLTPVLQWTASTRASSYEYCYATTVTGCTRWVSTGTARSATLPTLARNQTYYWSVRARNAGGVTVANNTIWQFTTIP